MIWKSCLELDASVRVAAAAAAAGRLLRKEYIFKLI